jgi:hypothetical protein
MKPLVGVIHELPLPKVSSLNPATPKINPLNSTPKAQNLLGTLKPKTQSLKPKA